MAGSHSGEFNPEEFGEIKARLKAVEQEAIRARDDRAKLFQAVNAVANNQQLMNEKLDRNHDTITKFVTQCGSCKIDMNSLQSELRDIKRETSTSTIRRKSQPSAALTAIPKWPWEQPVGVLLFNILIKALSVVGVAVVVALIIQGTNNATL